MLSVGTGLAPNHRSGLVKNWLSVSVNRFSIAFHITLLKVCREPVHILIIRQDGLRCGIEKIAIPYSKHCQEDWNIFFERLAPEMIVHRVCSFQKLNKVIEAYCACD